MINEYEIDGFPMSEWTNRLLTKCEEIKGDDLTDEDILRIIDYAMGFAYDDNGEMDGIAEQTMEALFE